jgi:hypothetical protein
MYLLLLVKHKSNFRGNLRNLLCKMLCCECAILTRSPSVLVLAKTVAEFVFIRSLLSFLTREFFATTNKDGFLVAKYGCFI